VYECVSHMAGDSGSVQRLTEADVEKGPYPLNPTP
jgi:hypothetical protein